MPNDRKNARNLHGYVRFIAVDVAMDRGVESVGVPDLRITSEVVERAVVDAATLIQCHGAISGLDRVHTALHGYLKAACGRAGLETKPMRESRSSSRASQVLSGLPRPLPGLKEVGRILNPMATIVDTLNPLRNCASVANPNEELLEEPEAMLVINAVRTLLHYLSRRLGK